MSGEAFGLRRAEREVGAALAANEAEVSRCLDIADSAMRDLRSRERNGSAILPADSRMLAVVAALWTRDRESQTFSEDEAGALYRVGVMALRESGGDMTTAAHALAAAAATGVLARLVAKAAR